MTDWLSIHELDAAATVLASGGVVVCATETLLGLLADATQPRAVERVVEIKGRDQGRPIAVLLPSAASVDLVATSWSDQAQQLAQEAWPGPLTMVAKARSDLAAPLVQEGKVGMRVPGTSPAARLATLYGKPLTATSANLTGNPAPADPADLDAAIAQGADAVLDAPAPGGAPSTVVDVTAWPFRVIRPGAYQMSERFL